MIFVGIFIFFLNIVFGLLVFLKRQSFLTTAFFFLALSSSVWIFSTYLTLETGSLFWGRVSFIGAILGIGFFYIFSRQFPSPKSTCTIARLVLRTSPLWVLAILFLTPLMVQRVYSDGVTITGTFGSLIGIYQVIIPIYVILAVYELISTYRRTDSREDRARVRFALLGTGLFIVPASLTNVVLPLWFNIYTFNTIGPLFSVCMIGLLGYAIVKHHLMDVRVVIQKGLIYTSLLVCVVLFYLLMTAMFGLLLEREVEVLLLSAGITTALGIFGVPVVEYYFRRWTDRFFFKDVYDFTEAAQALSQILSKNSGIEEIQKESETTLQKLLRVESAVLYLCNRDEYLQDLLAEACGHSADEKKCRPGHVISLPDVTRKALASAEAGRRQFLGAVLEVGQRIDALVAIPVLSDGLLLGVLFIGRKKSGSPFSHNDIKLLQSFSYQLGVAVKKALLFEQVKDYSLHLEEKVSERTCEIERLHNEQKRLLEDVAHGLQNPLTNIKGELRTIKERSSHDQKIRAFERSVDDLSEFIYSLLRLAKMETHIDTIQRTDKVSLSSILAELIEYYEIVLADKQIHIESVVCGNVYVAGKESELREVITNIVSNAVKYMPAGNATERTILIELSRTDTEAVITISDTGIGIPQEHIPFIFDRFYRGHDENGSYSGTGIGLAVSKKITEAHGGAISVKSSDGEGSRFTLRFPRIS